MLKSVTISFFIHALVLGVLLFKKGKTSSVPHYSSVELFNPIKEQSARRKQVKGHKKAKLKAGDILEKQKMKNSKEAGNDLENVKERKSMGDQRQRSQLNQYAQDLQAYIERNQFYPRRALVMKQTGLVKVRLIISESGQFTKIEIVERVQARALNEAAFNLLSNLKSFKPLPKKYKGSREFIIPINYQIGKGRI